MLKPKLLTMATAGSILFGLGLGPAVAVGVRDLLGPSVPVVATAPVLVVLFAVFGLAVVVVALRCGGEAVLRDRRLVTRSAVTALLIAVGAHALVAIDNANTTSWRAAAQMTAARGVNLTESREFGRIFARLDAAGDSVASSAIAQLPVDWRVTMAGGEASVLLRQVPVAGADCLSSGRFIATALAGDAGSAAASVASAELCGQWRRVELALPPGVSTLQIGHSDGVPAVLDVMVADLSPAAAGLWRLLAVVATTILVFTVIILAVSLRDARAGAASASSAVDWRRHLAGGAGAIVLFLVVANAFTAWFVAQERTIYTWDYSGYWMSSRNVSDFLRGGERKSVTLQQSSASRDERAESNAEPAATMPDPGAVGALIRNIRFGEYNVTSNLPVAIVMAAFGNDRMTYELSLVNIYALASVLLLILAVHDIGRQGSPDWPRWWPFLPVLVVLCFVPYWVPILRGYMGVSVAAFNIGALWLYFRQPVREIPTLLLVLIGALLLGGVLLQRWNAYWVVGFILLITADAARDLVIGRRFGVADIAQALRAPAVIGFSAFFLFAAIAWPKLVRTVTTDYADIYSAFQVDTGLGSALVRQVESFGAGITILMLAALVYLLQRRDTRRAAQLIGLQVLYCFVHFSSTQTMGPHQYFLVLPGLLVLTSLGLTTALASPDRRIARSGAGAAVLLTGFGVISAAYAFVPSASGEVPPPRSLLFSQYYRPPLVSNDVDEFVRLAGRVDELMSQAPPGQGVYVLGGSEFLNANHLETISASTGAPFESATRVLGSAVVDKRDGFPHEILRAYLVITSEPVQLSRRPTDHYVITLPAEQLFSGTGIGAAFERLPETYALDGGAQAVVFRRARPSTESEIGELSERLREIYPDRPYVYE